MWSALERLLDSSMFSPHGICLLWEPELIWLHVFSDAVIAIAYFSIPFALSIIVSKRRDFQFGWIGWSFAADDRLRAGRGVTTSGGSARPSRLAS